MGDFEKALPTDITNLAIRSGEEWVFRCEQVRHAIAIATEKQIAILGVEILRTRHEGFYVEGYTAYNFEFDGNWEEFVSQNNDAAEKYITEHQLGPDYGYDLTTASEKEFKSLKQESTRSGSKSVLFKIRRQASPADKPRWEEFELSWHPGMNVISSMMEIARNPVTRDGKATTPITYDSNCLEEVCGSCAMLINGRARMACSALVDNLEQPIRLEPLSKFPIVRDLAVDRSVIFENLKRVKAWVPIDGTYDLGSGPRVSMQEQEEVYPLSRCISCCCCMEVCPQFNEHTGFVGAATISQVRLFNTHPTGASLKRDRLAALMGDGGIQECGYAQNCVEICPKDIPLTRSISQVGGEVMKQALGDLFRK